MSIKLAAISGFTSAEDVYTELSASPRMFFHKVFGGTNLSWSAATESDMYFGVEVAQMIRRPDVRLATRMLAELDVKPNVQQQEDANFIPDDQPDRAGRAIPPGLAVELDVALDMARVMAARPQDNPRPIPGRRQRRPQ